MELMAVIEALRTVSAIPDLDETPIRIHSDSKYVVNAFNENWISGWLMRGWQNSRKQPVANRDLWEQLLTLVNKRQIEYVWVKGHSGDPMNEACDRLAVEQAEFARSQAGPWTSAGNPATATRNPSEMTASASRQAEPAAPVPADRGPDYHAGHADGYSEGRQLGYEAGYEACRQELDKFPGQPGIRSPAQIRRLLQRISRMPPAIPGVPCPHGLKRRTALLTHSTSPRSR